MKLDDILVNMQGEAEECSAFLLSEAGDSRQKLKVLAMLSGCSRREGIASYLDQLDWERFRSCLKRSAGARVQFLELQKSSGESCYVDAVVALKPFFDAVVCGELSLAQQIAEASPDAWREGEEYEEDFCYAQFVFGSFFDGDNTELLTSLMTRIESALPDGVDARLSLCQAFVERDAERFEEELAQFVWQWSEDYNQREKATPAVDEEFYTERFISIEGLAWMKLGVKYGLCAFSEMPLMPIGIWS